MVLGLGRFGRSSERPSSFSDPRGGNPNAGDSRFSGQRVVTPGRGIDDGRQRPAADPSRLQLETSLRSGKTSFNYAARHKALMNEYAQEKGAITKEMKEFHDKLGKRWVSAELERRPEGASRETERLRNEVLERLENSSRGRQKESHKEMVEQYQEDIKGQWHVPELEHQLERATTPEQQKRLAQKLEYANRQVERKLLLFNKRQPYALRNFERQAKRDEIVAKRELEKRLTALDKKHKGKLIELEREKAQAFQDSSHTAQQGVRDDRQQRGRWW